jgi:hypothetical protein
VSAETVWGATTPAVPITISKTATARLMSTKAR